MLIYTYISGMKATKTVPQIALEVMAANDVKTLGWGDCTFLDQVAKAATHTSLFSKMPAARHNAILNARDASGLFDKTLEKWPGRVGITRRFYLKSATA